MKTKCEHRQLKFSCKYDVECAECGDRVVLHVPDDDDAEVYFEILHKEDDGTYAALHRGYSEQMRLSLNLDITIH